MTIDHRPFLHFTPERNWLNDPNGLVWHDGEFHLFFQYNPDGLTWGNMSWGHAVSPDLLDWSELPIALECTDDEFVFSGSVVVDHHNSTGLGQPGRPVMVAIYTAHDPGSDRQAQALAWSQDRGRTWTRSLENPVLDIGSTAFRDPKVFWYEADRCWVMAVALAEAQIIRFYRSFDLHSWSELSEFTCPGPSGLWECPDLFELPVEGQGETRRWVLVFSLEGRDSHGWCGTQYVVGTFDGTIFTPDRPGREAMRLDYGADCYAAVTFNDAPDGQRILLGWMNNWAYAERTPAREFRGAMTLPRVLSLRVIDGEIRLLQRPVEFSDRDSGAYTVSGLAIGPGMTPVARQSASGVETIQLAIAPGTSDAAGICVRVGDNERTVIGYDVATQTVYLDRSRSGRVDFASGFAATHRAPVAVKAGERIELTVIVDRCSVEVFDRNGSFVVTDLIFPQEGRTGLELFACGGSAVVDLSVTDL